MVMEKKTTSSSSTSSSSKRDQKLKSIVVAVEEEEETMSANLTQGVPQEVSSEKTISERASFGLGVVRTSRDITKKHPTKNDLVYVCNICEKGFASAHALSGHHNCHKRERALETQQKKIGESSNSHQANPNNNSLFGENSQVFSSNVNHSWLSLCDFRPISCNVFPSTTRGLPCMIMTMSPPRVSVTTDRLSTGNTNYGSSSTNPLPNDNQLALSLRPTNSTRGGSNISAFNGRIPRGITDMNMNMAMVPYVAPSRFVIGNASDSSSSRHHLPAYNYGPRALSGVHLLEPSLGGSSISSSNAFNGGITRGIMDMVPYQAPYRFVTGNTSDNHLNLSIRPFNFEGGSNNNNNNNVYPGGVNSGIPDLNLTPCLNITGNSSYGSSSRNPLALTIRNFPPSPTTNISIDLSSSEENDMGVSYVKLMDDFIKNMVHDDDDMGNTVIDHDHEDQREEEEEEEAVSKSWGGDLSLSI